MICFDTNILIYIANDQLSADSIQQEPIVYASVTEIEALGYPELRVVEEQRLRELLGLLSKIPLSETIIQTAIRLRQGKRMSLGDAIVAATALETNAVLWTANTADFRDLEGLQLHNPLPGQAA